MTIKVELGAPSLTGKDANNLVAEAFGSVSYPLTIVVTNHMPRNVAFPEIGLLLAHVASVEGSKAEAVVNDADQFQRFASDVESIAELNGYAEALTVEVEFATEELAEAPVEVLEEVATEVVAETQVAEVTEAPVEPPAEVAVEPAPAKSVSKTAKAK